MRRIALALASGLTLAAAWDVAKTPPMGFNTWNLWGCRVTGQVLMDTAQAIHDSGLQAAGYDYVNSDDCWMMANRSASGEMVANPEKFPDGFKAVADFIHGLGLKSGLYSAKGPHTCAGFAASCDHEAQDTAQWASWGIDYIKDDSCSSCPNKTDNELYHAMWLGVQASGREMVLTVEGQPDNSLGSAGGIGNAKRVGHDINPNWMSMVSLVDIASGLWPYAHNSTNATFGGWWNDLSVTADMIEIGNAPDFNCSSDAAALARCQAHFSLWTIMKAPLILGNDIPNEAPSTLAVLSNKFAIAVNQDALGIQARRVLVTQPANASLTTTRGGALAVLARCNASRPTQRWTTAAATAPPPPHSLLFTAPCNPADAFQQWSFASGAMANVGSGGCIDKSAGSDPAALRPCAAGGGAPPPPAQAWTHDAASGHIASASGGNCLDVYNFQGPDVEIGGCKAPGDQDSNQVFTTLPGGLLRAASTGLPPNTCLVASSGPSATAVPVATVDAAGQAWCMASAFGSEGGMVGVPCGPGDPRGPGRALPLFNLLPRAGAPGQYTFADLRGGAVNVNNQAGASGPWPHTRYTSLNSWDATGAAFTLTPGATPSAVVSTNTGLLDDDLVGGVSVGGAFCLDRGPAGMLEVWVAPLSGGRYAALLFNRSPAADSITLPWSALNVSDATSLRVFDIWANAEAGAFTGAYTATVAPSAGAYLVLSPA